MAFHFKKTEPPSRALRRVGREHLSMAQDCLRKSRHPASVHGVRKEIKKLRALFQLVRGEIGRGTYRKAAKGLRRVAGLLAATRDARVRFKAFEQLAGRQAARRFPSLKKALLKDCRRESRRFYTDDSVVMAKRILRQTGKRVADLKFVANDWSVIEPGLKQSYRRGQQALRLARHEPTPEHFHEWRKQVKIFGYQLRLICPRWPTTTRRRMDQLDRLGKALGDEHDLVLLKQFAEEHSPAAETAALNPLIEAQQLKLRGSALKLGTQLYRTTPAALCQQLGKGWRAWRDAT